MHGAALILGDVAAITVAATIATLPLIAFYFHRVPLVGVPATLLALPAIPFILVTGAATALLGTVSSILAQPFGWLTWLGTAYLTGVVRLFSAAPWASFRVDSIPVALVWLYYALLLAAMARGAMRKGAAALWTAAKSRLAQAPESSRAVPWAVLVLVGALAALSWIAAISAPDGRLRVTFFDVGQGDSALIQTPEGHQILVDGGPGLLDAARALGSKMPFWDRTLEMVILTHPHEDHLNGLLEVLKRYRVNLILERQIETESPSYLAWRELIDEKGIPVVRAEKGQLLTLGEDTYIQVLSPGKRLLTNTSSDLNNSSLVLRLTHGDVSFLLMGDAQEEVEWALLGSGEGLRSTVLKVAHHGSSTSSSEEFLEAVDPVAAVISVGEDNRFMHPDAQVVVRLTGHVSEERLFTTRDHGAITFTSDGRSLQALASR